MKTVALIKSGSVSRGEVGDIIKIILGCANVGDQAVNAIKPTHPLAIERAEVVHLTRDQAERFYAEHKGRPYYEGLIESVTGPDGVVAMLLHGEDAIATWRKLAGTTDPAKARENGEITIRALYGVELPDNAVHGSDSPEAVEREQAIIWS